MPDHRLEPVTPLGFDQPAVVRIGPVTITVVVDIALASLAIRRGRAGDVTTSAAEALGLPLPEPGRAGTGPIWSAFWLGP
nr:sarcosine oxidase subunit gamma [Paracoccaceae bacterium]